MLFQVTKFREKKTVTQTMFNSRRARFLFLLLVLVVFTFFVGNDDLVMESEVGGTATFSVSMLLRLPTLKRDLLNRSTNDVLEDIETLVLLLLTLLAVPVKFLCLSYVQEKSGRIHNFTR